MGNNPLGGLGDMLGSLFGQDQPHRQQDYQDFSDRYDRYNDPNDPTDDTYFDPRDVQGRYRQMMRNAPPDVMDDAHMDAFQRLSPQQREQLAYQMYQAQQQQGYDPRVDPRQLAQDPREFSRYMRRSEQQNPGIMDQLMGNAQGPLSNPLVKMALAGAAAAAARRFLSGGGGMGGQQMGGGNPLGGLGGLFGGHNTSDSGGRRGGGGSPFGGTEV